ncbi:MAG: MarR family winged helix-turn-helix transcriptional regulator [Clostridiaceae bacterium]
MERPTGSIGKWVSVIYRKGQSFMQDKLGYLGLNHTELIFLVHMPDKGINQKYMSDHLNLDEALVTRIMSSLEKKGYITRKKDERDGRAYIINLTEEGKSLRPVIKSCQAEWITSITKGLEEEEITDLLDKLTVLADNAVEITKRS